MRQGRTHCGAMGRRPRTSHGTGSRILPTAVAVLAVCLLATLSPALGAGQWGTVPSLPTLLPSIASLPDLNRTLQFGGLGQEQEITQVGKPRQRAHTSTRPWQ